MQAFWLNIRIFLVLTVLTGVIYPLIVTGIAQLALHQKANGDILSAHGRTVGSSLIAQKFEGNKYFWPRPSSSDYNPLASGGSNLGPTSKELKELVNTRKEALLKTHNIIDLKEIPSELLYASGSSLDPHISPEAAIFQIGRIIKERNFDSKKGQEDLMLMIHLLTEGPFLGFIGTPTINVLKLNIVLDLVQSESSSQNIKFTPLLK
jgi:K+-transporting ATPase ATPase C chain